MGRIFKSVTFSNVYFPLIQGVTALDSCVSMAALKLTVGRVRFFMSTHVRLHGERLATPWEPANEG